MKIISVVEGVASQVAVEDKDKVTTYFRNQFACWYRKSKDKLTACHGDGQRMREQVYRNFLKEQKLCRDSQDTLKEQKPCRDSQDTLKVVSTCPRCGAPIYGEETQNVLLSSVPLVWYSCDCKKEGMFLQVDEVPKKGREICIGFPGLRGYCIPKELWEEAEKESSLITDRVDAAVEMVDKTNKRLNRAIDKLDAFLERGVEEPTLESESWKEARLQRMAGQAQTDCPYRKRTQTGDECLYDAKQGAVSLCAKDDCPLRVKEKP